MALRDEVTLKPFHTQRPNQTKKRGSLSRFFVLHSGCRIMERFRSDLFLVCLRRAWLHKDAHRREWKRSGQADQHQRLCRRWLRHEQHHTAGEKDHPVYSHAIVNSSMLCSKNLLVGLLSERGHILGNH